MQLFHLTGVLMPTEDAENVDPHAAIAKLQPRLSSATLQALVDEMAFQKFNASKSANTLKAYRRDLQAFAQFIYGPTLPPNYGYRLSQEKALCIEITHGEVSIYQVWLLTQGYALTSINRALYALRTYARQALLAGAMPAEVYQRIAAIQSVSGKAAANLDEKRPLQRRPSLRQKKPKPHGFLRI
jgi:hypothetical protein